MRAEPELDLRSQVEPVSEAPNLVKRSFSGRGTWYDVEERICACGDWHKNNEYVVAMSEYCLHRFVVVAGWMREVWMSDSWRGENG